MNKKAQVGFSIAKSVLVALLVIAIIGVSIVIVNSNLRDSAETAMPQESGTVVNETLTSVAETGETFAKNSLLSPVCTIVTVINSTNSYTIASGNYTQTNCNLKFAVGDIGLNNTNWKVTYTYTYEEPGARQITGNVSAGTDTFFNNASTWLTILAVVILLGIIAIVISVVTNFQAKGVGGAVGKARSDDGLI